MMDSGKIWLSVGFFGQAMFTGRFLVQWIASEIRKSSVIPLAFWWLSLAGSLTLLSYAVYRKDPVFILGQMFGSIVYIRNLVLIRRGKQMKSAAVRSSAAADTDQRSSVGDV